MPIKWIGGVLPKTMDQDAGSGYWLCQERVKPETRTLRAAFLHAHSLASTFHPPYPPIASQSISRDMLLARARVFHSLFSLTFEGVAGLSFTALIDRAISLLFTHIQRGGWCGLHCAYRATPLFYLLPRGRARWSPTARVQRARVLSYALHEHRRSSSLPSSLIW